MSFNDHPGILCIDDLLDGHFASQQLWFTKGQIPGFKKCHVMRQEVFHDCPHMP